MQKISKDKLRARINNYFKDLEGIKGKPRVIEFLNMLGNLWIDNKCPKSGRVQIGHVKLREMMRGVSQSTIQRKIDVLLNELPGGWRFIYKYVPGDGKKGQKKNISPFSCFYLSFPDSFFDETTVPIVKQKFSEAQLIAMAKATLIRAGADEQILNLSMVTGHAHQVRRQLGKKLIFIESGEIKTKTLCIPGAKKLNKELEARNHLVNLKAA